jgi:hypothetical protein
MSQLTSSSKHLTVRAEAAVEDSALVGRDLDSSDKGRVAPDAQRVVGETAWADNLTVVRAPAERSNLRASVDAVDASTRGGVPEVDVAIVRATTSSKEVHVPGAPREGLDGSLVVGLGELGDRQRSGIPDGDEVVVAASSELGTIGAPLKTANLGSVGDELGNLVLSDANIVVVDKATAGTSGEKVLVPTHNTNAGVVTEHASDLLTLSDIPDLDLAGSETNTDIGTITRPLDAANVGVGGGLEETADATLIRRPNIDVALKTDGNLVARAPVEQVEVVVINEAGSVKNTFRGSSDAATDLGGGCGGGPERSVVLLSQVDRLGWLGSGGLKLEDTSVEAHAAGVGKGVLVSNSVRGRSRIVVGFIIIVDVQALKSSQSLIGGGGEDIGALNSVGLGSLSVWNIQLTRASIGDGRACTTVRDESVASIVYGSLGNLGTDTLLVWRCLAAASSGESVVRDAKLKGFTRGMNNTGDVGLGGVAMRGCGRSSEVCHEVTAVSRTAGWFEVIAGLSLGGERRRVEVDRQHVGGRCLLTGRRGQRHPSASGTGCEKSLVGLDRSWQCHWSHCDIFEMIPV